MSALTTIDISALVSKISAPRDKGFFKRCWSTSPSVYQARLKALGFTELSHILDAGCGYGQWTAMLAQLNTQVTAMDFASDRIQIAQEVIQQLGLSNIQFTQGDVESLTFEAAEFDGVYSY